MQPMAVFPAVQVWRTACSLCTVTVTVSQSLCVCVCVKALTIAKGFWNIDKHLLYSCRGVRHDCGTALNEATTVMGYLV